jgi:hypothetical protein
MIELTFLTALLLFAGLRRASFLFWLARFELLSCLFFFSLKENPRVTLPMGGVT